MGDSTAGSVLLKMLKYPEVMLNISEFSPYKKLQNLDWFMQMRFRELPNQIS